MFYVFIDRQLHALHTRLCLLLYILIGVTSYQVFAIFKPQHYQSYLQNINQKIAKKIAITERDIQGIRTSLSALIDYVEHNEIPLAISMKTKDTLEFQEKYLKKLQKQQTNIRQLIATSNKINSPQEEASKLQQAKIAERIRKTGNTIDKLTHTQNLLKEQIVESTEQQMNKRTMLNAIEQKIQKLYALQRDLYNQVQ